MKKLVSLVLALALCAGLAAPAMAAEFTDVPAGHAFYDAIMDCSEKGIVGGYGDGTFRPANTVTNSNFTVMLSRAFYADEVASYVAQGYQINGTFYPNYIAMQDAGALRYTSFELALQNASVMNKGISRYDMALLLANILKNKGLTVSDSEKTAAQAQIADYNTIPDQYKDAVAAVYALGIIGGYSDGTFGGGVTMNRGQAAVVIYRLAQFVDSGSGAAAEAPAPAGAPEAPAPETPANPEPGTPETPPASSGRTLSNGQAITEDNVTEILKQMEAKYPGGTSFGEGYYGLGSGRSPANNCIAQITGKYWCTQAHNQHTSTYAGCGGWAAFVADEIFGQKSSTWNWKKTTLTDIRPGDLMIKLDDAGYLMHVGICTGLVDGQSPTVRVYSTGAGSGGTHATADYKIGWNRTVTAGINYDIYTAYPD